MRYQVNLLLAMLISGCSNNFSNTMSNNFLLISVQCMSNTNCHFNGDDIFINIDVKNVHSADIDFPLSYLQKTGPIVKLVDSETNSTSFLKKNLADPSLIKQTTKIKPGQSVIVEWVLTSAELLQFKSGVVDLTAEVTIAAPILLDGETASFNFEGTGSAKIVGKLPR